MANPAAMIGFSDAGAHLRNMAFYNFPLRMLKRVRDAERAGRPFMTVERRGAQAHRRHRRLPPHRCRPAGHGARADVVVIDPQRLDDTVEAIHEAPMPGLHGPAAAWSAATTTPSGRCSSTADGLAGRGADRPTCRADEAARRCADRQMWPDAAQPHRDRASTRRVSRRGRYLDVAGSAGADVGGHCGRGRR